jgi:hypothetical protein
MEFRTRRRGARCRRVSARIGLAVSFVLIATAASATTLVAVWAPDQLIIGADSAVIYDLGGVAVHGSACKIGRQESTFFAFSGLVDDYSTGFEAAPLAEKAAREGGSLKDRIAIFAELVRDPLAEALARLKADSPADYEYLRRGHPALQAMFADVREGAPSLGVVEFVLMPNGSPTPTVRMVADGDDGRGPRIIYAGQQSEIRRYLAGRRDWYNSDLSDLVRKLVQLEIDSGDGRVGGPVDVLKISPHQAAWVQKKPACAPIRPAKGD